MQNIDFNEGIYNTDDLDEIVVNLIIFDDLMEE